MAVGSKTLEVIAFEVGARRCSVELERVQEVVRLGPVTHVPSSPVVIVGATHLRGQVVAVIDLSLLLNHDPIPPQAGHPGLLLSLRDYTFVLMVNRVLEVIKLEEEMGQPQPYDDGNSSESHRPLINLFKGSYVLPMGVLDLLDTESLLAFLISQVDAVTTQFRFVPPIGEQR